MRKQIASFTLLLAAILAGQVNAAETNDTAQTDERHYALPTQTADDIELRGHFTLHGTAGQNIHVESILAQALEVFVAGKTLAQLCDRHDLPETDAESWSNQWDTVEQTINEPLDDQAQLTFDSIETAVPCP